MESKKVCEQCGAPYERPTEDGRRVADQQWAKSRYCSHPCFIASRKRPPIACEVCGKEFVPRTSAGRHCSGSCYHKSRKQAAPTKPCEACGTTFSRRTKSGRLIAPSRWAKMRYCSECFPANRGGNNHSRWQGGDKVGQYVNPDGYVSVKLRPHHPFYAMANSAERVFEHRLVMAEFLGRPLTQHETVHHINGDRQDNRLENLQLRNGRHGKGRHLRCRACGSSDIEHLTI